MKLEAIDQARGRLYGLCGLIFTENGVRDHQEAIKEALAVVVQNPFDDTAASAAEGMRSLLRADHDAAQEYTEIFITPFRRPTGITASFYHEQREGGRMLLLAREFIQKTPLRRDEKRFLAPEDHFGFLFGLMEHLLLEGESAQARSLFESLLNPYMDAFITSASAHEAAELYRYAASFLERLITFDRSFLEIEAPLQPAAMLHEVRSQFERGPRKKRR